MARRLALPALLLLGVLGAAMTIPLAGAQDGATEPALDLAEGYLYVGAEPIGTRAYDNTVDNVGCEQAGGRDYVIHGFTPTIPSGSASARVAAEPSYGGLACAKIFHWTVTEPFILQEDPTFTFWGGCSAPVVTAGEPNSTFLRVALERNGEEEARWSLARGGLAGYCWTEGPVAELQKVQAHRVDAVLDVDTVAFAAGDALEVKVWFFLPDPQAESLYFLVDSAKHPTSFHGVGVPGALRADPHSDLTITHSNLTGRAGPGNATTIPLTVENVGALERDVLATVESPEGWSAEADPPVFDIPPGGSVTLNVTLTAPPDAPPGYVAEHMVSFRTKGEEARVALTTEVVPGTGAAVERPTPPGAPPADSVGIQPTGDATAVDGAEAAEPAGRTPVELIRDVWVEALATAVVTGGAALVTLLRRGE